jgi:hypothetical protein
MLGNILADALAVAREPDPSETQISRLQLDLSSVADLARRGIDAGKNASASGGGKGGGLAGVILAAIVAAAVALGIPVVASSDDVAQAKVLADTNATAIAANLARILAIETRQADEERRARRIQGLTIRWLGDSLETGCTAQREIADGINRLLGHHKGAAQIEIDCSKPDLPPPDLVRLVADLEISESLHR